jgi:hypothetical protein
VEEKADPTIENERAPVVPRRQQPALFLENESGQAIACC